MRKLSIEIKWALIFAATTLLWVLGEKLAGLYSTHIDKHTTVTYFFFVPAITLYVLALLDKRRNYYGGAMTWKQGFVCGLLITLFVTILSPLTQTIVSNVISPEYFPNAISFAVSTGEMNQQEAEQFFSLKSYIVQGLIGAPVMGIVTSAIVAIFTRRAKKDVPEGKVDVVYTDGPKTPQGQKN
jgi:uncharacterized membrane protein YGL010W